MVVGACEPLIQVSLSQSQRESHGDTGVKGRAGLGCLYGVVPRQGRASVVALFVEEGAADARMCLTTRSRITLCSSLRRSCNGFEI